MFRRRIVSEVDSKMPSAWLRALCLPGKIRETIRGTMRETRRETISWFQIDELLFDFIHSPYASDCAFARPRVGYRALSTCVHEYQITRLCKEYFRKSAGVESRPRRAGRAAPRAAALMWHITQYTCRRTLSSRDEGMVGLHRRPRLAELLFSGDEF